MAVVTRFPTTDAAVSGTWTSPTNVQADDGATASVTPGSKNTSAEREQGGYGFDGVIPAGSTIDMVELIVEHHVVSPGVCFHGVTSKVGAQVGVYEEDTTEPTSPTVRTYDVTASRPNGGTWTRADLLNGTFGTRIRARNGNNASGEYHWDYVSVRVTFTPPPTQLSGGSATDAQRDFDTPFQDITVTFNEPVAQAGITVGATNHGVTIKVANVAQTTTYRSGSGTATWVFRVPIVVHNGQTISASYNPATGAILAVDDNAEVQTATDVAITNSLTKRIHVQIFDLGGSEVTLETVAYAVYRVADDGTETPGDVSWGSLVTDAQTFAHVKGSQATDALGILDFLCNDLDVSVGELVYLAVHLLGRTPKERAIIPVAVQ